MAKNWGMFVDLDGVLVDFDAGVRKLCGASPDQLEPSSMWKAIAHAKGFYEHLDWMADGKELWAMLQHLSPFILTGLPRGTWAEPQKRRWCGRELGSEVKVITCLSKNKHLAAKDVLDLETVPVLIDDRYGLKEDWEDMGGIFIHHTSAFATLAIVRELGIL